MWNFEKKSVWKIPHKEFDPPPANSPHFFSALNTSLSEVYSSKSNSWSGGPDTPHVLLDPDYCVTQINSSHTMQSGGIMDFDYFLSDVWLYDWSRDRWSQAASLHSFRKDHLCTSLDGGRAVVAGGVGGHDEKLLSMEIYEPESDFWYWYWLPETHYYQALVNWDEKILYVNYKNFWLFENGQWIKIGHRDDIKPFEKVFAFLVPDDFVPGC